jgi:hypothetical protein
MQFLNGVGRSSTFEQSEVRQDTKVGVDERGLRQQSDCYTLARVAAASIASSNSAGHRRKAGLKRQHYDC